MHARTRADGREASRNVYMVLATLLIDEAEEVRGSLLGLNDGGKAF
jgi:hypothetical protein